MLTRKQRELLLFVHHTLQQQGIPPSFDEMKDALDLKSKSGIHRLITALEERGFIRRLPNRARALEIIRLPEGHQERIDAGQNSGQTAAHTPDKSAENMSALARRGFTPSIIDGGLSAGNDISATSNSDASNVVSGEFGEMPQSSFQTSLQGQNHPVPGEGGSVQVPVQIPVMGRIAAGVPISAIENHTAQLTLPPDMVGQGEHFALEVEGASMINAGIHDGDTVIVRKSDTATAGDIVVALIDDEEATLKTFQRKGNSIALEAANPDFETRIFDPSRVKVQGRLVGLIRRYH